ncbi:hypothetical protein TCAL_06447 [Tigriopus californicus]|uniref:GCS light chain n=1 Tax=Tigriopus californicus TaxID=6832 RepID=A0A553NPS3_TIGCA|nr:glutamate--cysteine ligase regulatory subunit-like [Tigriopus californicus]TRY67451.1 hypothetical protein TCAL_06447 [Tigriopus californicus]|eukprot:TCALIF_06447-PA protein Name:"Similar to Gclm Glutamate--cysteine ligase regulatory subunit (Rattus norvegicus)" AED:0.00 eAED:0.00 QI:326/1/1/1/1/1/3/126/268
MPSVTIVSSNLLLDKELRKKFGGNLPSTASEVKTVVQEALTNPESHHWHRSNDGTHIKLDPKATFANGSGSLASEDVEVKVKFFPVSFEANAAQTAIEAVFENIKPFHIDSLQISVPIEALDALSIGPQPKDKDADYEACLNQFVELWQGLESHLDQKKVKKLGICDIETATLEDLYGKVIRKPSSININLQSCCVVPPELVTFAKNNNIQVNTHSDPDVLLSNTDLAEMKNHDLNTLSLDWIIRYLILDQKRGVLKERRFIIGLKSE